MGPTLKNKKTKTEEKHEESSHSSGSFADNSEPGDKPKDTVEVTKKEDNVTKTANTVTKTEEDTKVVKAKSSEKVEPVVSKSLTERLKAASDKLGGKAARRPSSKIDTQSLKQRLQNRAEELSPIYNTETT